MHSARPASLQRHRIAGDRVGAEPAGAGSAAAPGPPPGKRGRWWRRILGPVWLLLIVLSCASSVSLERVAVRPELITAEQGERGEAQRESLGHLFYFNNPMPPPPREHELARLERDLAAAPPVEVEELRDLFGHDAELLVYATRDSDGDGVLDYRISEYRGKFFEGDIDLDGDGIRNVYDVAPYDSRRGGIDDDGDGVPDRSGSFADRDGDGIPDHLDWSRRKPEPLPSLQAALFRDFDLILVERGARFTPELVRAVDDTMRFVFRERIPTLRTVAIEEQLLISPDLGDNGFMLAQTQTLTVYRKSIERAEPLVLFGLMVHEVAHAWQLAQDFDERNLVAENKKMHYELGRFTAGLERFGWEIDRGSTPEGYHHRLYWPHFYATSPRYLYRGSTSAQWADWFDELERESGSQLLRTRSVVTWGLIGPYSLTSPWEWHADQLMASVYNRMATQLPVSDNRSVAAASTVLRSQMLETVQLQWRRFDYRNAVGTSVARELEREFPLSSAELDLLTERYVLPLTDLPVLARPLDGSGWAGAELVSSLESTWVDLRERMGVPESQRLQVPQLSFWVDRGVELGTRPWLAVPDSPPVSDEAAGSSEAPLESSGQAADGSTADRLNVPAEELAEDLAKDPGTTQLDPAVPGPAQASEARGDERRVHPLLPREVSRAVVDAFEEVVGSRRLPTD